MLRVRTVLWAGLFDLSHRFVTCNMIELRAMVRRYIRELQPAPGSRVLDFGSGTGLYAALLIAEGFRYHGFDIDDKFVAYAQLLYPRGSFASRWSDVAAAAPFQLVIANCCFHHIGDTEAATALDRIQSVLAPDGVLLFIDHIPPSQPKVSQPRRLYRLLERGRHIRTADDYERLIAPRFTVKSRTIERSYVWSLAVGANPLFNELVVLRCAAAPAYAELRSGTGV
jgi:SAM-dependent methyltransferase